MRVRAILNFFFVIKVSIVHAVHVFEKKTKATADRRHLVHACNRPVVCGIYVNTVSELSIRFSRLSLCPCSMFEGKIKVLKRRKSLEHRPLHVRSIDQCIGRQSAVGIYFARVFLANKIVFFFLWFYSLRSVCSSILGCTLRKRVLETTLRM